MILMATSRASLRSRARYTVAMPPWPISSRISYLSRSGVLSTAAARTYPPVKRDSGQLLHPDRVGCSTYTHTCSVYHDEALAGLHEPVVGQKLRDIANLILEA